MKHDRDLAWLTLIVWMAPSAFATAKEFYYLFGLLILAMSVLAEIAYWVCKRTNRLLAELEEAQKQQPSNVELTGAERASPAKRPS